ncbi:hypothetical protein PV08_05874 [Exophiala spinifera]|uniref:Fe2OG dioxygenase domain-containing protein n=1 Tax=Exophiala spinifera TaxID=91928 RepID=A0A0D2BWZ3_9EURO|nr:uncharacterized protein PV08_05874 [Exophiala spinifera]KIW15824.1 hypothetical protein PV08_05874 [Exophiala spinifera]
MDYSSTSVSKGVDDDDLVIPVINFQNFLQGDRNTRVEAARAILDAFRNSGFIYLSNHGVSDEMVNDCFSHVAHFFARPQDQKDSLAWTDARTNRGYVKAGREKLNLSGQASDELRNQTPDLKETMEIGWDGNTSKPNKWPERLDDEGVEFSRFMRVFYDRMHDLNLQIMSAIALGMGLDEAFFTPFVDAKDNNLRILHYPSVRETGRTDKIRIRAGAHSDYGSITLLLQDSIGGLEVQSPRGTWVRAKPIPGTIVVNAGDLLSRWSNDLIKSTKHRVVQPPPKPDGSSSSSSQEPETGSETILPERYSVAYFCIPNFDALIDALPGTWELDPVGKKYPSILSGEYQYQRLSETF